MAKWGYYNEVNKFKAEWTRQLMKQGVILDGDVDERPIEQVQPEDVRGYVQCHWFSGIAVWSFALRRAGWPDDRPVWTGSCPCTPFSLAGKQEGFDDPRHLWPEWFRLIRQCRPDRVFGEQVSTANAWLDLVQSDLEGDGYAVGAVDLPAAGFGGAHIRQRFCWVADRHDSEWWAERAPWNDGHWPALGRFEGDGDLEACRLPGWVAGADASGRRRKPQPDQRAAEPGQSTSRRDSELGPAVHRGPSAAGGVDDATGSRHDGPIGGAEESSRDDARMRVSSAGFEAGRLDHHLRLGWNGIEEGGQQAGGRQPASAGCDDWLGSPNQWGPSDAHYGFIRRSGRVIEGREALQPGDPSRPGFDWLFCRDGKWRPVESTASPLVDAATGRVVRLRGYGDALDAETAAQFIAAYMESAPDHRSEFA